MKHLKALINSPYPSGKLARWGMVLQEMDLKIFYRPRKHNSNADALSRAPVPDAGGEDMPYGIISVITAEQLEKDESGLSELQRKDSDLASIISYLETRELPEDKKLAKRLALTESQFMVQDGILYHVESDSTLRVIPPTESRKQLFDQAHVGSFGGHLRNVKVHSELQRHYWWPGMRKDGSLSVLLTAQGVPPDPL